MPDTPAPSTLIEQIRDAAPDHEAVAGAIARLVRARVDGDADSIDGARLALGRTISRIAAAADLVARATLWLDLRGPRPAQFAAVPRILPRDAVAELLEREPSLARSAEEIRRMYDDGHAFAAALSVDLTVTRQIQDEIEKQFRAGRGWYRTAEVVRQLTDWSRAYAENVVRTNVTTAYSSGRFREAERLEEMGLVAALRFSAVLDGDTRPNHAAAHGLVAGVNDPVWERLSPPLGYQCRCTVMPVDPVDVPAELKTKGGGLRRARVPAGAAPDYPEFGRRPDTTAFLVKQAGE